MPWVRVWLHIVWATKDRRPYLVDGIRSKVFAHIRENARAKGIYVDFLNGWVDHVHCLISLGTDQTIEKIMQLLKGESSFWINKSKLTKVEFEWQDEYFVVSVNENSLDAVRRYIGKQEDHHANVSFDDEFREFLSRAGFRKLEDR